METWIYLLPWICLLAGIIVVGWLLWYFIKNYQMNQKLLLEMRLQHEVAMKNAEWERKKEWEIMLIVSSIVNTDPRLLAEKIAKLEAKNEELEKKAEKAKELEKERAIQEKVLLIYQLLASKEEVTVEKMKEKQARVKVLYESIETMIK